MHKCLEILDLVEIRRDFFDKNAAKRVLLIDFTKGKTGDLARLLDHNQVSWK